MRTESSEIIGSIKDQAGGYHMVRAMQDLASRAAAGESLAQEVLQDMLTECQSPECWTTNSQYCSAVIHAVASIGSLRSMQMLLRYARALPDNISFGTVDLISSVLPTYRRIIMGPIKDLLGENEASAARAVGIQTLCNLYLEGSLQGEETAYLEQILKDFDSDGYLTQHVADLVRLEMAYKEKQAAADLDEMLKGFLVGDGA
ncbi:MAG: hypothetical protein NXI24_02490 [bacterium]|nr:hypothetical protein [bacterium]